MRNRWALPHTSLASDELATRPANTAGRDALSRAGVTEKQAIEVEVGPSKPYEAILDRLASGGSRAEWRRSQGIPDDTTPALAASAPDAVVDAEIVAESDQQTYAHPTDTSHRRLAATRAAGPQFRSFWAKGFTVRRAVDVG